METLFSALGSGGFLFLGIQLIIRKNDPNRLAGRFLGLAMFAAGAMMLDDSLREMGLLIKYPYLFGLTEQFQLVLAPAFFLGVRAYTETRPHWHKYDWLHFLPAALFFVTELPTLLLSPAEKAEIYLHPDHELNSGPLVMVVFGLWFAQIFTYLFLAFRKIILHQKTLRTINSLTEDIDLRWLQWFVGGFAVMILVWANDVFEVVPGISGFSSAIYLIGVCFAGYFVLGQGRIFSFSEKEIAEIEQIWEQKEVSDAQVPEPETILLRQKLELWMENEKPYLLPGLTLPELARQVSLSTHELSFLLNQGMGQNFYTYVNHFRVEEAKRLLADPKYAPWTLIAVGFEAGFNSKTTFNTTFRESTGLSPSAFRKSAMAGHSDD